MDEKNVVEPKNYTSVSTMKTRSNENKANNFDSLNNSKNNEAQASTSVVTSSISSSSSESEACSDNDNKRELSFNKYDHIRYYGTKNDELLEYSKGSCVKSDDNVKHVYQPKFVYRRPIRKGTKNDMAFGFNGLFNHDPPIKFRHSIRIDDDADTNNIVGHARNFKHSMNADCNKKEETNKEINNNQNVTKHQKTNFNNIHAITTNQAVYVKIAASMDQMINVSKELADLLLRISHLTPVYPLKYGDETSSLQIYNNLHIELCHCAQKFMALIRHHIFVNDDLRQLHFLETDFASVIQLVNDFSHFIRSSSQDSISPSATNQRKTLTLPNSLMVVTRRMLDHSLLAFVGIICDVLKVTEPKERLLSLALNHLGNVLCVFDNDNIDEELYIEAVKGGAMDKILELCRNVASSLFTQQPLLLSNQPHFLTFLLRLLTMLCRTSKGCLQFLSISGLDFIQTVLLNDKAKEASHCSIEAAAILAQLLVQTPSYLHIFDVGTLRGCVKRLLQLVDNCDVSIHNGGRRNPLVICISTLAILCTREFIIDGISTSELLYQYNAPPRLIHSLSYFDNSESHIYVKEQIITIFSQMVAKGYAQSLIAQKAIPFVLKVLLDSVIATTSSSGTCNVSTSDNKYENGKLYSFNKISNHNCGATHRNIAVKAALCLTQLTRNSAGLKALRDTNGAWQQLECLLVATRDATDVDTSTLTLICADLKQRLNAFHLNSTVFESYV